MRHFFNIYFFMQKQFSEWAIVKFVQWEVGTIIHKNTRNLTSQPAFLYNNNKNNYKNNKTNNFNNDNDYNNNVLIPEG